MKLSIRQGRIWMAILGGAAVAAAAGAGVVAPSASALFIPGRVVAGRSAGLFVTMTNGNVSPLSGVALTDTLPPGLELAADPAPTNDCGGSITASAGASTFSLSGGALDAAATCTVSVQVVGTTSGVFGSGACTVSATGTGSSDCAASSLAVAAKPTLAKAFTPATTAVGSVVTLSFTVANPNDGQTLPPPAVQLSGIGFVDDLPAGLAIATPNGLAGSCLDAGATGVLAPGIVSAPPGGTAIELSGLALDAPASCTFSVDLVATSTGTKANLTSRLGYSYDDLSGDPSFWTADAAAASLVVGGPDLTITKTHVGSFAQGATGQIYTVTVSNQGDLPTSGVVTVTDALPAGLIATVLGGSGWTGCSGMPVVGPASISCQRADLLAASASYPPLTLTVSVAPNAPSAVVNVALVSGGNDTTPANGSAIDPTTIDLVGITEVPTLDPRALAVLAALLAGAGAWRLRRG